MWLNVHYKPTGIYAPASTARTHRRRWQDMLHSLFVRFGLLQEIEPVLHVFDEASKELARLTTLGQRALAIATSEGVAVLPLASVSKMSVEDVAQFVEEQLSSHAKSLWKDVPTNFSHSGKTTLRKF